MPSIFVFFLKDFFDDQRLLTKNAINPSGERWRNTLSQTALLTGSTHPLEANRKEVTSKTRPSVGLEKPVVCIFKKSSRFFG